MARVTAGGLPSLSVVIPTTRGGADLDACIDSLAAGRYPALEAIVVDNGSPASLEPLAERLRGLRVLRNEANLGFVGACNQGLAASGGELVLFLNDDTVVEPGALRTLVETLDAHPSWGACQAKLLLMDDPTRLDTAGSFLTATGFLVHRGAFGPESDYTRSDEVFAAKGAALLVRRQAIEGVGAFDPDFFAYFEETDLCWRLWLAGWEVGFAADARIRHRLGGTASALPEEFVQFHSYKNRIRSLVKNPGARRLVWMLPLHLSLCLGLAGWYGIRGRSGVSRGILRGILWNARHLPATIAKRSEVQRRRRVSDRELMPRISRPTSFRTLFAYARSPASRPGPSEAGVP